MPLFEWQGHQGAVRRGRKRVGNGLRIFLDRPWWSSGDEEKLALVFSDRPTTALKQWITQWGFDPVYASTHPGFKVTNDLFPLATAFGAELSDGRDRRPGVSVAGHEVDFDTDKKMWFADVKMDAAAVLLAVRPDGAGAVPAALDRRRAPVAGGAGGLRAAGARTARRRS